MNPSLSITCSRLERGENSSRACETSFDNFPTVAAAPASAMFLGLESAAPFLGRGDWAWDAGTTAAAMSNPVLLSLQREEQFDFKERKPQITSVSPFRAYNGPGMEMGLLNSPAIRGFGASDDRVPSSSSSSLSRGGLLYSQVSGFGAQGYDPRSQLLEMTSMKEPSYRKEGTIFHDIMKRKDACAGDFQARIGLNLGQRTYFPPENADLSRLYKRSRTVPAACQVEGCRADLTHSKHYHRRHKVCEFHSKASGVITGGVQQRFCQQCSRFHALSEFDEMKRSCRKRLADHNRRRRKPHPNAVTLAPSANTDQAPSPAFFKAFNAKC